MAVRELVGPPVKPSRCWSISAAAGAIVCGVLFGGLPAHAQPVATTSAVADYGACLAGQKHGDLLLLLDESGSLAPPSGSDPQAMRVPAAKRLLEKLAAWTAHTQVRLDVAIAGFGDSYSPRHDWATLDGKSLPGLNAALDGARDRTQGKDTNYGVALTEALRALTVHRPEQNTAACRGIAWFTDGELDFGTRNEDLRVSSIATTRESICRPGGIADQLRATGVRTFAIGLGGVRSVNGQPAKAPDFGLLESIATGKPFENKACGDIVKPRPGEFYAANNIDELLGKFADVAPGPGPVDQTHNVCPGVVRADCLHKFVLDNSIRAVKVEGDGGIDGLTPTLIGPSGRTTEIPGTTDGALDLDGVTVNYRWVSGRKFSFDMANTPGAQWRGVWALAFVDKNQEAAATQSKSSITIYGNLVPTWTEQHERTLHAEEKTLLRLGITDRDDRPVEPAGIEGTAELSASIVDHAGVHHDLATGISRDAIGRPVAVSLAGVPPGAATLRLSLAITTAPSGAEPGTVLSRELVDIPLKIAPPAGFPEPGTLDFGELEGSGEFAAVLPVHGEGCVWLTPAQPPVFKTQPEGAGRLTLTSTAPTSAEGCAAGQQARPIPVVLTIEHETNGVVHGTIPLTAARASEIGGAITIEVPFRAEVRKRPDYPVLLAALVMTCVLGPGIPLLLLYFAKWITARIPGQTLKAQQFQVRVENGVLLRDGVPFTLRETDLVDSVPGLHRSVRKIDLGGVWLRARTGWSPLGRGHVTAHAPGMLGASSVPPRADRHGNAVLPLAVRWTWFVLHDPDGPPDTAILVLLLGAGASPTRRAGLAVDASKEVPGLVGEMRDRHTSRSDGRRAPRRPGGADAHDPFASSSDRRNTPGTGEPDPFSDDPATGAPSHIFGYVRDADADPFGR